MAQEAIPKKVDDFRKLPQWKKGERLGRKRYKTMKFESEAMRRDYLRAVGQNKYNVPGMPVFFPAPLIWATGIGEGEPTEKLPCGHPWRRKSFDHRGRVRFECKYGHTFDNNMEVL